MTPKYRSVTRVNGLDDRPAFLFLLGRDLRPAFLEEARLRGHFRCMFSATPGNVVQKIGRDRPDVVVIDHSHIAEPLFFLFHEMEIDKRPRNLSFVLLSDAPTTLESLPPNFFEEHLSRSLPPSQVFLHLKAVLRRAQPGGINIIHEFGDFVFDESSFSVFVKGRRIRLTRQSCLLLAAMIEKPHFVWTRESLISHVWGQKSEMRIKNINKAIQTLRNALDAEGARDLIQSNVGFGYSFSPPQVVEAGNGNTEPREKSS
jgi:two-component system phosphate regulon response regulator PhoB